MTSTFLPLPRRPLLLAASLLLAGAMALSIHVAMLGAGVPFPVSQPPGWARWLNQSIAIGAIFVFLQLADPAIGRRSLLARTLITFVLLLTIRETLRGAIMGGVVTGGWAASALGLAEPLLRLLITALLCVLAQRWVRGAASLVQVALATGALVVGAHMLLGAALAPLREAAAALGRPALYEFPYPAQVMIPAYLTFTEAVVGATLLLMLVWNQLPGKLAMRLLASALLVALLKGIVGVTLLFSFFMEVTPLAGMLGYSQFLFEFLALGLLAGLAWEAFGRRRDGRA